MVSETHCDSPWRGFHNSASPINRHQTVIKPLTLPIPARPSVIVAGPSMFGPDRQLCLVFHIHLHHDHVPETPVQHHNNKKNAVITTILSSPLSSLIRLCAVPLIRAFIDSNTNTKHVALQQDSGSNYNTQHIA